ncbi:MAG: hypothetical protein IPM15_08565 [Betaproteobacteria bacterium]|nr:hypothetical protein [Betaproteobacteria bacterium]MCC6249844.1 hypothetical protein [Rubrivivax sp.]MCL4695817.1 hypothetical protein [Burkholderiaceae bacterium]
MQLLGHPKRISRSKALGFCGAVPVGMERRHAPRWWPGGEPTLLALEGASDVRVLLARGNVIPGSWSKGGGGKMGAAAWQCVDGALQGRNLHVSTFERTWAEGAGGGWVVGVGVHKGKLGARPRDAGLVWDTAGGVRTVSAAEDVCLRATDGTRLAGVIGARAALWPSVDAPPVDLAPAGMPSSEVCALDGERQIGLAFKQLSARAVLRQGTAASAQDLTPVGCEAGTARESHYVPLAQAVLWRAQRSRDSA